MSNHTPGPWTVTGWNEIVVSAPNGNTLCLAPGDEKNCPFDRMRANARLIAAAPELLAALHGMVDMFERHIEGREGPDDVAHRWDVARAALAKATGPVSIGE